MGLIGDRVGFADLSQWIGLDDDAGKGWQRIKSKIRGRVELPEKILPYPFQKECISAAKDYCGELENSRGKIILPCGTGKSLLGFWISQELGARNVLLVVPSLTLVSQILRTWTEQSVAHGVDLNWFAVCSDESVGKDRQDQLVSSKYDLGIPCSTDVDEITAWLSEDSAGTRLTVTTYNSGPALAEAATRVGLSFGPGDHG
jgi:predicted helicase